MPVVLTLAASFGIDLCRNRRTTLTFVIPRSQANWLAKTAVVTVMLSGTTGPKRW
jgi:hypothetical protein